MTRVSTTRTVSAWESWNCFDVQAMSAASPRPRTPACARLSVAGRAFIASSASNPATQEQQTGRCIFRRESSRPDQASLLVQSCVRKFRQLPGIPCPPEPSSQTQRSLWSPRRDYPDPPVRQTSSSSKSQRLLPAVPAVFIDVDIAVTDAAVFAAAQLEPWSNRERKPPLDPQGS